ncbi:MAG TPA: hypothetical protein VFY10_03105, partial [Dehalococcoidia bacterium]|nr:hypothetical protein [Dehalococcoidia bacterium]
MAFALFAGFAAVPLFLWLNWLWVLLTLQVAFWLFLLGLYVLAHRGWFGDFACPTDERSLRMLRRMTIFLAASGFLLLEICAVMMLWFGSSPWIAVAVALYAPFAGWLIFRHRTDYVSAT